jgi:hypothetical protein
MWKIILSFLSGPLSKISGDLKEAYKARLEAQNDKERLLADERIAVLEARKTSILAAQSNPVERFVRPAFAFPFVIYLWKLILWDKVLELGATDPLSPELSYVMLLILGGYFIDVSLKRIFK